MGSRLGATAVAGLFVVAACSPGASPSVGPAQTTSMTGRAIDVDGGVVDDPAITVLSEVQQADMTTVIWHQGCPLPLSELRSVAVPYVDFEGVERVGQVVVHHKISGATLAAFEALFEERFPLAHVKPLEQFGGDFRAAMSGNNTFAFECRRAVQTFSDGSAPKWSAHAYGLAIDVNPLQNPHVVGDIVTPIEGKPFLDRDDVRPGMLVADSAVVKSFTEAGFTWSGDRKIANPDLHNYDYQHFVYNALDINEFSSH